MSRFFLLETIKLQRMINKNISQGIKWFENLAPTLENFQMLKAILFNPERRITLTVAQALFIIKQKAKIKDNKVRGVVEHFAVTKLSEIPAKIFEENLLAVCYAFQFTQSRALFDFTVSFCKRTSELLREFYWNLHSLKHQFGQPYITLEQLLLRDLGESADGQRNKHQLHYSLSLMEELRTAGEIVKHSGRNSEEKERLLEKWLATRNLQKNFANVSLPISNEKLSSAVPSKISVFKSAMFPVLYRFDSSIPAFIFKTGDLAHKDRLLMFFLNIFQTHLTNIGIPTVTKLYRVIPLFRESGIFEFVERSVNLRDVVLRHGSLESFYSHVTKLNAPASLVACLRNFLDSNAFYTAACYLLAVGDRHKDNILLLEDGTTFHIDFSYIFGDDPKFYAPRVRVTKEMIDFISIFGEHLTDSELSLIKYELQEFSNSVYDLSTLNFGYAYFVYRATVFYNALRTATDKVLCLMEVMRNAYIPEKGLNINRTLCEVDHYDVLSSADTMNHSVNIALDIVRERFQPNLSNVEAGYNFVELVIKDASAFMPKVIDKFHDWAQAWR